MQDKAGEIGEMIRELIILEIQKLWKEKKEEWMEQFEQRLRSLEEKSPTLDSSMIFASAMVAFNLLMRISSRRRLPLPGC